MRTNPVDLGYEGLIQDTHDHTLTGCTYCIHMFGCQMNKHDSERIDGILSAQGALEVPTPEEADIVVFMTCCVREAPDTRLAGQVASLKNLPCAHEEPRIIVVGGCMGQRDGERLTHQLPNIDIVFGTHNLSSLPSLIDAVRAGEGPQVEIVESSDEDTSSLPSRREHAWHAWLPITSGCNNFCTYCIVPYVRGREKSRAFEEILSEATMLVAEGVREITLLGQNVNSYGRDLYGKPRFSEVLRAIGQTGVDRLRFATSHPKDLSDDTIVAMAAVPSVMPQLHLPVQSGSDAILKAMHRIYTRAEYLALVARIREAMPDISLSTDIIVGFTGEAEDDFRDTLELAREVSYGQAFTFIYSPREGTPAASMEQTTTSEQVHDRFDRLLEVIQETAHAENQKELHTVQRVLIEGVSRRDASMLAGRTEKNQMVHAPVPSDSAGFPIDPICLKGQMVDVRVEMAKTWFLSGKVVSLPEDARM
jgi:tRNA-2-methylthio-N6-dimethylallyladenosine synthase